jgi:hypothetical protein
MRWGIFISWQLRVKRAISGKAIRRIIAMASRITRKKLYKISICGIRTQNGERQV